jgi:Ca2+-binding RTX toxin-like protein
MAKDTSGILQELVESLWQKQISHKEEKFFKILFTNGQVLTLLLRTAEDWILMLSICMFLKNSCSIVLVNVDIDGILSNPNPQSANILNSAYSQLTNYIYAQLESQTHLKSLYDLISFEFDATTSTVSLSLSQVTSSIQDAINNDQLSGFNLLSEFARTFSNLGLKTESNYSEFYNTFSALGTDYKFLLDTCDKTIIYGTSDSDSLDGTAEGEAYITGEGADTIYSRQGDDIVYAGAGDDYINSCEGNDTIFGEAGNDTIIDNSGNNYLDGGDGDDYISIADSQGNNTIYGGAGDDTIALTQNTYGDNTVNGGVGDDTVSAGSGNTIFTYNLGDGNDTINSNAYMVETVNTIEFGAGISKENIKFRGESSDLIIYFDNNTTDSIRLSGQLSSYSTVIHNLVFTDGTSYTSEEIAQLLVTYGTEGDDTIYGSYGNETIYGYGGNDTIQSQFGDDFIMVAMVMITSQLPIHKETTLSYGGAGMIRFMGVPEMIHTFLVPETERIQSMIIIGLMI